MGKKNPLLEFKQQMGLSWNNMVLLTGLAKWTNVCLCNKTPQEIGTTTLSTYHLIKATTGIDLYEWYLENLSQGETTPEESRTEDRESS